MNLDLKDSIKFTFSVESTDIEDSFEFSQTAVVDLSEYNTALDAMGGHLNIFLKLLGYTRKKEHIFMEDLSSDECDFLNEALKQYREYKGGVK